MERHSGEYPGQWVALDGDVLVASGDDLSKVIESVEGRPGGEGVLFVQMPRAALK